MSSVRVFSRSKSLIFSLFILINVGWLTGCISPEIGQKFDPSGMTTPQVPTSTQFPITYLVPTPGDSIVSSVVRNAFQFLFNGVDASRLGLYAGGTKRRVVCTSNTAMTIQPLGAAFVTDTAVWTMLSDQTGSASERVVSGTLNPTTLAGGSLSANTRYWVYAFLSGGKIAFEATTTAPDSGLAYSSGGTDRLWVSTFYVDHASNILPYSQSELKFLYYSRTAPGGGARGNLLLDAGTTSFPLLNAVSVGTVLPTQATSYQISAKLAGSDGNVLVIGRSTAVIDIEVGYQYGPSGVEVGGQSDFAILSGASLYYGTTGTSYIWLNGFTL